MFEETIENKFPGVYASRSVKPTQLCNHIRHILITSQMVLLKFQENTVNSIELNLAVPYYALLQHTAAPCGSRRLQRKKIYQKNQPKLLFVLKGIFLNVLYLRNQDGNQLVPFQIDKRVSFFLQVFQIIKQQVE